MTVHHVRPMRFYEFIITKAFYAPPYQHSDMITITRVDFMLNLLILKTELLNSFDIYYIASRDNFMSVQNLAGMNILCADQNVSDPCPLMRILKQLHLDQLLYYFLPTLASIRVFVSQQQYYTAPHQKKIYSICIFST